MSDKPTYSGEAKPPPPYDPNAQTTLPEKQPLQKYGGYSNTQPPQEQQQITQVVQPAPQIIYVQQPQPIHDGIPTTTQVMPVHTEQQIPVVITTTTTNKQPTITDDYLTLFRTKLNQPKINCGCECCNLWIATHVWLILYIIFAIIQVAVYGSAAAQLPDEGVLWVLMVWYIIYICINVWCLYGLYQCQSLPFLIKLITLGVDVIFTILVILFVNWFAIIDLILIGYMFWVFWKVWKWAQYFEKGGIFDENMIIPGVIPQSAGTR
eukprot:250497_1